MTRPLTLGIEEEYLLVDAATGELAVNPPDAMMAACQDRLPDRILPEFLKCQIEVRTDTCSSIAAARADLSLSRRTVVETARQFGLAPIAAGTHPFARWRAQQPTAKERYQDLARDLAGVARRMIICGCHVHVGVPDEDMRVDLMNQVSYFLPHLLALSTSSPFWRGEDSGLMSYRLAIFDSLPRTGLPERFESWGEYQRMVRRMVTAGLINDGSKIWWDVRPSARFPTLEMRITDVCTRLEDCLSIAALYACVLSMLTRLKEQNQRWRIYANALIRENRWMAQRYGAGGELVDFGKGTRVPYRDLLDELIELCRPDAERYECVTELERCRDIAVNGTSAHHQLNVYRAAIERGATQMDALRAVVSWLIQETAGDVSPSPAARG